jgi:hypothetical protein
LPNPANNVVSIFSDIDNSFSLKVVDLTGKTILDKELNGIENTMDLTALSSGIYFFKFASETKSETVKIIKN